MSIIPESLPPYTYLLAKSSLSSVTTEYPAAVKKFMSILDIAMIGAGLFDLWVRCHPTEVFAILLKDIEKALKPKRHINLAIKLPKEYHKFFNVFLKKEADTLSEHQSYNYTIPLKDGKQLLFKAFYKISQDELKVLWKYLDDYLSKGFIRASSSPAAAPVLFIRKSGRGLQFYVDYQGLNTITIKNYYPLLLIKETLDYLCYAVIYTKLDIITAFI